MAVATKDPVKLQAAATLLAGAGIAGPSAAQSMRGNQSLHVNFATKTFSVGSYPDKRSYSPREYIHGWFNLDDPQGAVAFLGAGMSTVFNPPKVQPSTWQIGSRVAAADPTNKRIVIGCNVVARDQINDMVLTLDKGSSAFVPKKGRATYDFGFQASNNDVLFTALMVLQGVGYAWNDGTKFFDNEGTPGNSSRSVSGLSRKVIHVDAVRKLALASSSRVGGSEYPSGFFDLDSLGVQCISKLLSGGGQTDKVWRISDDTGRYSRDATADYGRKAVRVVDDHSQTLYVPLATLKEMAAALN